MNAYVQFLLDNQLLDPIVTALAFGVSLYFVNKQLGLNRKQLEASYQLATTEWTLSQRSRSLEYSVFTKDHIRTARQTVEKAFGPIVSINEALTLSDITDKALGFEEEGEDLNGAILTILAHWEAMALAIKSNVVDDEVCFEMVGSTLCHHVRIFRNYIERRRENNQRVFIHLMELQRAWGDRLSGVRAATINDEGMPSISGDF